MPVEDGQFGRGRPVPPPTKRQTKKERYAGYIAQAEDLLSDYLPEAARAAIAIAMGEAKEYLINHKTGAVHEVPCNPATRLKAVQFITERIAGKPEATKTHELGQRAEGMFRVLMGPAAQEHWDTSLAAPADLVPLPIEGAFVALPAASQAGEPG